MRALTKITALWLVGVFAFFYGGNTLFMHSHFADGHRVVHSHPYLPGSTHSHTDTVMHFLSAANQAAAAMAASESVTAPEPFRRPCGEAAEAPAPKTALTAIGTTLLRAPPTMC